MSRLDQLTPAGPASTVSGLLQRRHRSGGLLAVLAVGVLAAVLLVGRGGDGAAAQGRAGDLTVTGGYVREPASPDTAAGYLTVRNDGAQPDTLRSITTSAATSVMVMAEFADGTMSDSGPIVVPAHGSVDLTPGRQHLMLDAPRTADVHTGGTVRLQLVFDRAGPMSVDLPVVPIGATP